MGSIKTYFRFAAIFFILAGCSLMRVSYDLDSTTDFKSFNTYRFTRSIETLGINSANREILSSAISNELESRNYEKTGSLTPDIWIEVFFSTSTSEKTTQTGDQTMGMDPYRYGGNFTSKEVNYHTYKQGTLFTDIIDASKNEIVWEGRVMIKIEEDWTEKEVEKKIYKAINKVFGKYPIRISDAN